MNGFYADIIRELRAAGFHQVQGGKGSHEKWALGSTVVIVPHGSKSRHTANSVMKSAGLTKRF